MAISRTKLIAFEAEYADIKKYFPKLSDDEAIRRAATYVKDTMPTYGEAAPLARFISRTPFIGNYVLFPSEVLRTTKNILKYTFFKDLPDAFRKGKTKAQRAYHLKRFTERLVGLGSIGAGAEYMVSSNNEANGIGSNERKVLNSILFSSKCIFRCISKKICIFCNHFSCYILFKYT